MRLRWIMVADCSITNGHLPEPGQSRLREVDSLVHRLYMYVHENKKILA